MNQPLQLCTRDQSTPSQENTRWPYAPTCYWPLDMGELGLKGIVSFVSHDVRLSSLEVSRVYGTAMLHRLLHMDTFGLVDVRTKRVYEQLELHPHIPDFLAVLEESLERALTNTRFSARELHFDSTSWSGQVGLEGELHGILTMLRDPTPQISGGWRLQGYWRRGVAGLCYLSGAAHPILVFDLDEATQKELRTSALRLAYDEVFRVVEVTRRERTSLMQHTGLEGRPQAP